MSKQLFVNSYLQVAWWALDQSKGRQTASNDNSCCKTSVVLPRSVNIQRIVQLHLVIM